MSEWLSFLVKWLDVPLATIAVFEGTRRLAASQFQWRYLGVIALGVAVLGVNAAGLWWGVYTLGNSLNIVERQGAPEIPREAMLSMGPQEREEKSRLVAQLTFSSVGSLIPVYAAAGPERLYAPTEAEIRERERFRVSIAQARTRIEFMRTQVFAFILALLSAAVSGLLVGRRGRPDER